VQEAVSRALALRPLTELSSPEAYLRTSIANIARNLYRQNGRRGFESEESYRDRYPSDLGDLTLLAPADRAALFLVDVESLSYEQAAQILECSQQSLRTRASRARRRLNQKLTAVMETNE
jgi:DNA-directed RNA polymerase specialized sigma24 family protein